MARTAVAPAGSSNAIEFGYARVSKRDRQDPRAQLDSLERAGIRRIYTDRISGAKALRPELERLIETLRAGDVVVVWKLDRLSRGGVIDLLSTIQRIHAAGARIRSLTEPFDTTSAIGEAMVAMLGVFANLERRHVIERTTAGLASARKRGVRLGAPRKLNEHKEREAVRLLQKSPGAEVARLLNVHPSTISRLKRRAEVR